jgi:ferrochelatase
MSADGVKRALAFILSSHQTEASWERYQKEVEDARSELGYAPEVDYCPGWHAHPLFIEIWAERIGTVMEKVLPARRKTTPVIFTAHSVPVSMASASPYAAQIEESCRLVAIRLGHERWSVAYQSRSGRPGEPWLEPDISEALKHLAPQAATEVVVAPVGFVSDHVEVLYDLDVAARKIAEGLGMRFLRASCPNDHPTFIRMMAEVIKTKLSAVSQKSPEPTS